MQKGDASRMSATQTVRQCVFCQKFRMQDMITCGMCGLSYCKRDKCTSKHDALVKGHGHT